MIVDYDCAMESGKVKVKALPTFKHDNQPSEAFYTRFYPRNRA